MKMLKEGKKEKIIGISILLVVIIAIFGIKTVLDIKNGNSANITINQQYTS